MSQENVEKGGHFAAWEEPELFAGEMGGDAPPAPALANLIVDEKGFGRLPEDDFVT
jgi:hypothetical protein